MNDSGWVPFDDFDPSDPEEMEIMAGVFATERADSMHRIERDNEALQAANAHMFFQLHGYYPGGDE